MHFILLIIGFILLVKSADWFVEGSSNIAKLLGIPSLIVGLTIVAFGTSAPEAAVSINASIQNLNEISLGNVIGSNIANLLLVLGLASLFGNLTAKKKVITRDYKYLMLSSLVLLLLTFSFYISSTVEGVITKGNGILMLCFLGLYLYVLIEDAIKSMNKKEEKGQFKLNDIVMIIFGLIGIIMGGELVVNNATIIAKLLNISDNIIALTIVAIGTSLPEVVTSIVAAKKGESDIAIGNVVGSNIFNVFFVLGMSSTISPITFGIDSFIDVIVMFIASIIVYLMILKNKHIDKKRGIFLILFYIVYMIYIFI